MENGNKTIALLGQPNSGKSSLFNRLTGSHHHVGNWPGKTVEHKAGSFTVNGTTYSIVDLPGSYSLSAGSQEEVVTTGYIRSGQATLWQFWWTARSLSDRFTCWRISSARASLLC